MVTRGNPLFRLEVDWEPVGIGLREIAEGHLAWRGTSPAIEDAADLVDLMYRAWEG